MGHSHLTPDFLAVTGLPVNLVRKSRLVQNVAARLLLTSMKTDSFPLSFEEASEALLIVSCPLLLFLICAMCFLKELLLCFICWLLSIFPLFCCFSV